MLYTILDELIGVSSFTALCPISSSKFNTVSSYRIRMVTRQKREVYTNVGGIKIRRNGVPRAYQEEIGSTGPASET